VAVLVSPVAVALAESLGISPRSLLIAVMMAGSAALATLFGYQTNVVAYQMGGHGCMGLVRVGLPVNLISWDVAVAAIQFYLPF
jgi:di/tricarboxylate transporter